jgi:hypothetical protein
LARNNPELLFTISLANPERTEPQTLNLSSRIIAKHES